jgi:hypothetical protein
MVIDLIQIQPPRLRILNMVQHLKLEVAWLKPVGSTDDSGEVNPLTSTDYSFLNTVEERAAHNGSLPGLSVLTAVNVVFRDEIAHVDIDEIENIVEMMKTNQAITDCMNVDDDDEVASDAEEEEG